MSRIIFFVTNRVSFSFVRKEPNSDEDGWTRELPPTSETFSRARDKKHASLPRMF